MQNQAFQVFEDAYLEQISGDVSMASSIISSPLRIVQPWNNIEMVCTVQNAALVNTMAFTIEGSYDGEAWNVVSSVTRTSFGVATVAASDWPYPFLRVRAVVTQSGADTAKILFSVRITLSHQ